MIKHDSGYLAYHNKELSFRGRAFTQWTDHYKGPLYLYDLEFLQERCYQLKQAMPQVSLFYAMKANSNPEILKHISQTGMGADVVSGGELKRALDCGFLPEKIIFSGVAKTKAEIELALSVKIRQINVESLPELERIVEIAKRLNLQAPVSLRINPNIDAKTHPYISTGLKSDKFGIEIEVLLQVMQFLKEQHQHVKLLGLSFHLGSQIQELSVYNDALCEVEKIVQNFKVRGFECSQLDVGGGFFIDYENQNLAEEVNFIQSIGKTLEDFAARTGLKLLAEPGRWLVGHVGVLLCQVQYVKKNSTKTFVIVDSGMNHLIRPALYEAKHLIFPLVEREEKMLCDVVGPICESSDFFAKDIELSRVEQDDFIVVADAGAYGFSMASLYNLQALPEEKFVKL